MFRPIGGWHPWARFRLWLHLMWGYYDTFRHGYWHSAFNYTEYDGNGKPKDVICCLYCLEPYYSDWPPPPNIMASADGEFNRLEMIHTMRNTTYKKKP